MSAEPLPSHTTQITIDGKAYEVNCPPGQVEALHEAAEHLNNKIQDFRQGHGNNMPLERLAIITALNMTHEKLDQERQLEHLLSITSDCLT